MDLPDLSGQGVNGGIPSQLSKDSAVCGTFDDDGSRYERKGRRVPLVLLRSCLPKKQGNVCVEKMKCDDDEGGTISLHQ